MKNKKLLFVLAGLLILMGCNNKGEEGLQYSNYVEAFTSGDVSRFTPVYLLLSQDVDSAYMNVGALKKALEIKPNVAGKFSFENNRTIVFRPENTFERGTSYSVNVDLSKLINVEKGHERFSFSFSTYPLDVVANLNSLNINEGNENGYDVTVAIYTPDKEDDSVVEALIKLSEDAVPVWQHNADGRTHEVRFVNIPAGAEDTREIVISSASNKYGVRERELLSVTIPSMNTFSLYDMTYVAEPERYIEASFSKTLDDAQKMHGLAFIEGNKSETMTVDGNKLRLYPDAQRTGEIKVHFDSKIRSKNGLTLEENIVRQISIDNNKPAVRFIGKGVIIPQSTELIIPFEAVYLRGVIVRVIRINEQNIGQFLQVNDLSGTSEIIRVGRIVARKTIFLDEQGADLSRWNTFAVDLKTLMQPEPGAIYRVELDFNRDLSAYPCDKAKPTKEEIAAKDEIAFREELSRFDEGGYYYYYNDFDWSDYNYREVKDPCSNSYYNDTNIGRNVLATNLGVIAKSGEDGDMTVLVNNILTARPENNVKITVYNYQHQELAQGLTNDKGVATVSLGKKKPFYVVAMKDTQRSYLRVDGGSALSFSTFDVSGEVVQKGLKGFIYGERGVWRPGDTLHLTFMLNDRARKLPENHPVVMELKNPLGQVYLRRVQNRGELGLYRFSLPTEQDITTGIWNAKVEVGGVSFEKNIRIESIKPNRLKINFPIPDKPILRGEYTTIPMHVEWLQGATARNLKYDIQGTFVSMATSFDGYKDYVFDDPSKLFSSEESSLITGKTDESGNVNVDLRFETGSSASGMLLANLVTRVYEESGDFSIDGARMQYSPYKQYVGIKSPRQDRGQLDTGKSYNYDLAVVDYQGKPAANVGLSIEVFKVYWYWWWSSDKSRLANYISESYNKPVTTLSATADASGKASFKLKFEDNEWGTYFIRVKDNVGKHTTGIMSYFDWPYYEGRRNTDGTESAVALKFKTDKDSYSVGETMTVTFPSSKGSRAIVSLENGTKVLSIDDYDCEAGETTVKLNVTKEMQPNAYVYITLLQPHAITKNDLPIRLYGVVPFSVTSPESYLTPVIDVANEIKPEKEYSVAISEKNGREMAYTLAIVDEGLLDLTRFPTPDPWKTFNAREALGVTSWDLYNYVVGAYGGRIEQIFSIGGDDALNNGPKAIVNRFKPVVRFEGPFRLKKGEKKRHTYMMPNYNGRVRVMVVAGDGDAYGNAEKSVMVRKPVMLLGTLPRIIGVGEEMSVPATVFATEKGVGNVNVSISCSSNMEIVGSASTQLSFSETGDKQAYFRIRVKNETGVGKVTLKASGKGETTTYDTEIEIRSVRKSQTKVQAVVLEAGKSWKETVSMPGADGTNRMTLEVANIPPLNIASRVGYLLGYPHGCVEQITSKAFPQLYIKEFASLSRAQEESADVAVKEVISRLRSYQVPNGSFAYWPGGGSANDWGTVYAFHFLLEAEAKGYLVPNSLKQSLLSNIRAEARKWQADSGGKTYYYNSLKMIQAYRLFVLAKGGTAEVGAMNRLKEQKNLPAAAKSLLASAYSLVGRKDVADELIFSTKELTSSYDEYDLTFGSDIRDKAIRLQTLCLQGKAGEAAALAKEISETLSNDTWLNTQATSFALVAMSDYMGRYKTSEELLFSYATKGKKDKISTRKNIWSDELVTKGKRTSDLEITNTSKSTLFVRVITEGIPEQGEETAYSNGLKLSVNYYSGTDRKPVSVDSLSQGTNLTVEVVVSNPTSRGIKNVVLSQIFPAGWEILNTRFINDTAEQSSTRVINHQDIRDDRVYSYIDYLPSGRQVTVKMNICAVYSGTFYLPPVYCETMYDNTVRANTEGRTVCVY